MIPRDNVQEGVHWSMKSVRVLLAIALRDLCFARSYSHPSLATSASSNRPGRNQVTLRRVDSTVCIAERLESRRDSYCCRIAKGIMQNVKVEM